MRACGERPSTLVADTGRMPTKGIWDRIPWAAIVDGSRDGMVFFDDFINCPTLDEADAVDTVYASYGDAGADIRAAADDEYGAVVLSTDGGDNEEVWMSTGGNVGGMTSFVLQATGAPHIVAFECRVKKASITAGSMFVGLGEPGMAVANTVADGGTIVDKDYIGFWTPEADMDGCDAVYNEAGGTNPNILIADYHTWVASAYVKLGFVYDYRASNAQQISFWKNGVKSATYITKALMDVATEFASDTDLALLIGGKEDTTTGITMTMDWWKLATVPTG